MARWALLMVAVVAASGCAEYYYDDQGARVECVEKAYSGEFDVRVEILNASLAPERIEVKVTSLIKGDSYSFRQRSFSLANSTGGQSFKPNATEGPGAFPTYVELGCGDSAMGWLEFPTARGPPPFRLIYGSVGASPHGLATIDA